MKAFALRGLAPLVAALALAGCAALAPTQAARTDAAAGPPKVLLWVGNSFFYYNNSMHGHVAQLVRGDKSVTHRGVSVTISGSGIDWHDMESYLGPDRIGKYSFVAGNEIKFNPPGKQFDAVMFMDCSQCPVHPQLKPVFHAYAKKHSDTIRAYGANPVLFMSWAYKDKPEMTAQLAEQYTNAGNANGAQVVPAGLAFARSVARRPDLELYAADKRHPSLAGTYLGACTVYAALLGKSPVGNAYTAGLPADVAAHLQAVAWDTVKEYSAK
ncbi:MAG: hypothetical protein IPH30_10940 [Betaproteobacteria bacterium]|nr:hypothetical protein [Betaproteobacteria bacterium]